MSEKCKSCNGAGLERVLAGYYQNQEAIACSMCGGSGINFLHCPFCGKYPNIEQEGRIAECKHCGYWLPEPNWNSRV